MSIAVTGTFFEAKGSYQTFFFSNSDCQKLIKATVSGTYEQSVGPGHGGHISQAEISTVLCTFFIGCEETASVKSGFEAAIHSNSPTKSISA